MTLSARSIALQGFALSPVAIAVQGLIAYIASGGSSSIFQDTSQGKAGNNPPQRDYLSENLRRVHEARDHRVTEEYNLTRLQEDDRLAADFIVALVTKGLLHECV